MKYGQLSFYALCCFHCYVCPLPFQGLLKAPSVLQLNLCIFEMVYDFCQANTGAYDPHKYDLLSCGIDTTSQGDFPFTNFSIRTVSASHFNRPSHLPAAFLSVLHPVLYSKC